MAALDRFLSIIYSITVFFSELFGDDRQEEELAARGNTLEVRRVRISRVLPVSPVSRFLLFLFIYPRLRRLTSVMFF